MSQEALDRVPPGERTAPVSKVAVRVALQPTQTLEQGMEVLTEAGTDVAPVVHAGSIMGLVTSRGILRAYRVAAQRSRGPSRDRSDDGDLTSGATSGPDR